MSAELVTARHLSRKAVIYVRQSSPHQVLTNQESLRLQYALRQRARELGWQEASIEVIDADLGLSGAAAAHRRGFKDLIARVTLGEVGIVLSSEVTRLARNCSDWYPLLDLCGYRACLIADRDGVYDPGSLNGRLLLGLKGTMSELELHLLRGRLTAGLLSKAARGELALQLPAGLVRDADGRVTKDPDREVRDRLALIFATFLEQGSVAKVMRSFRSRQLAVPRRDRFGAVAWRAPTTGMLGGATNTSLPAPEPRSSTGSPARIRHGGWAARSPGRDRPRPGSRRGPGRQRRSCRSSRRRSRTGRSRSRAPAARLGRWRRTSRAPRCGCRCRRWSSGRYLPRVG